MIRLPILIKLLVILLFCSSCYYNKKLIYFQDKDFSYIQPTLMENHRPIYRVQANDVLSVKVKSSTDHQVSDIFNIITTTQTATFSSPANNYLEGYNVDEMGRVNLPILGLITVKDLTLDEVQALIQTNANKYLKNATVVVKLVSFKITVIGEVNNPGYHYVYNSQATILEALGLAGDLTIFASRKNVKLIRPVARGSEVVLLDLKDPNLLKSKYFYLMPNDVLYVEPLKARSKRSNLENLTLVFSAITTAVLILNYIDNNQ
ncbi:MAG TPA: polysaccharide biosynthesis/export family protein [Chryseolinea sp.]|nr:polysaccharide biosynthesis/export family protein [Chryseolinea sp.]